RSSKSLRGVASTSRSGEESSVLKQDAPTRLMSAHQYDGEGLNQVARRDRAKRSTFSALQLIPVDCGTYGPRGAARRLVPLDRECTGHRIKEMTVTSSSQSGDP